MTSSKCKQCGLVNPFNAPKCKRCGYSLISQETPTALRAIDQKPVDKKVEKIGTAITETEVQAVCYICGTSDDVHSSDS